MGKVENAQRIGPMEIDKALDPLGSILHGSHLFGLTDSPTLGSHRRQLAKGLCIGQTRKIREVDGLDPLLGSRLSDFLFALDFSNDHRFDFGPHASHQRHHRPITTEEQFGRWLQTCPLVWAARLGSPHLPLLVLFVQQVAGLLVLDRLIGRSCRFGVAASCRFTHLHPHQLAQ